MRSVMIYGSETWLMRVEDKQRMERTERMMVRHVWCGIEGQEVCGRVERKIGDR
jgi:hypothetical protein